MAFFVPDSEGASAERHGVLTEDTDDAIGFRLSLSLSRAPHLEVW
jgi:hypothetical protein